ncbi:hypothetical protein [Clostridium botulinum]|uniref:hypothetical protein n=1 Tax=Clostridium botulinum TaxID=1491 RepID=UPI001E47040E|nr:hypothetical protein [Clostridium botulinum]MCD3254384.1 hypothetical protein [Clostridium botulinum C/D]MCD3279884.1 hypothetical protein [Clostridium botulinum C/D]MCD3339615.1 hypothetical protein [Clostridium botulinum C/D]MCD3357523.1 hypothetical protein [Clostridium botulinum C/D]
MKTYYQRIFDVMNDNKIDVYAPYQKTDKCVKEYVVIKDNGQNPTIDGNVNGWNLVQIFCYYPKDQYSQLEPFSIKVKHLIKNELMFMKVTGSESPVMFMDDVQAYLKIIEYTIPHKLK